MIAKWSIFSAMLLLVCAALWAIQDPPQIRPSSWLSHLACLAIGAMLIPITMHVTAGKRQSHHTNAQKHKLRGSVYSLGHARLNVNLPPPSMWMNMGYWTNAVDFPNACEALLREVLKAAGLLTPTGGAITRPSAHSITLLDLGFGCGDQTLYLNQQLFKIVQDSNDEALKPRYSEMPLIDKYVGITVDQDQFKYAIDRVRQVDGPGIQVFCADAAKPAIWDGELGRQVKQLASKAPLNYTSTDEDKTVDVDCWILALDTLYHFSPSRSPILEYAREELNASIMAFDLLLAETTTFMSRVLLGLVAALMGCPYNTFKTISQYRASLISAGYADDRIEIRDISEHVFRPLATYLEERESHLEDFGWNLGKLKAAKWLFNWWASNGVVRGAIIIARK